MSGPRAWYPLTDAGFTKAEHDLTLWRERFDVYMGVLPRVAGGGTSAHLRRAGWFWADIDPGSEGPREALALLEKSVRKADLPPPQMLVLSGGGVHAYWRLKETVECRQPWEQERLRRLMRRLVRLIGGDHERAHACPRANDAARILRLPGTWNHKIEGHPRPVRLLRLEPQREAFSLVWWEAHLPAEPLPLQLTSKEVFASQREARRRRVEEIRRQVSLPGLDSLPPATRAKLATPAPNGHKHYTMLDVAVSARKRGLSEDEVLLAAEQVGIVSGVNMSDPHQIRHRDGVVSWVMRTVA